MAFGIAVLIRHYKEMVLKSRLLQDLLDKGRGKYRNIFIVGPANCGKTFILNSLNKVFATFSNPATTTFAWVGAEHAECIFLIDFRWSAEISKFSKGQPRIPTLPLNKRQFPRLCDAESEFEHYVFYPSQIFSEDGHLTSFSFYLSSVSAFDRWTILICYTFWQFHSPKVM